MGSEPRPSFQDLTPEERTQFFAAAHAEAVAAAAANARTIKHVPIVSVGEWPVGRSDGTTGTTVTREKLERAVAHASGGEYPRPVVGLGHGKDRKPNGQNGTPSLGDLSNLTIEPNDQGVDTLYADLEGVPTWAADRYPRRSAEWWETTGGDMVIHRLALLGDEYPAIDTLEDLQAIVSDEGPAELVAAGAVLVSAAFTAAAIPAAQTEPVGPDQPEEKDDHMTVDQTLLRRSLGLPEDADEAAINDALTASLAAAESGAADEAPAESAVAEPVAVAAAASDTVSVERTVWESTIRDAEFGRKAFERITNDDRLTLVSAAASAGKIPKSRIDHWVGLHKLDPEGIEKELADLEAGVVVPVGGAIGHSVDAAASDREKALDDEYYAAVSISTGTTPKTEA
jgi:hypothetical protein